MGPFGLLDTCWDPASNPDSPFTREAWAMALDPNVNVWMASVIWSLYGWQAWSTCDECKSCETAGGEIPHPDSPLPSLTPVLYRPQPVDEGPGLAPYLLLGLAVVGLVLLDGKKGGY
ncbi:MAG: hypothetical protein C4534_08250 [Gaiellales bacterium]|nr:MAG: hypothetical protein C4534_08250 [Gaiellales bacterium]